MEQDALRNFCLAPEIFQQRMHQRKGWAVLKFISMIYHGKKYCNITIYHNIHTVAHT